MTKPVQKAGIYCSRSAGCCQVLVDGTGAGSGSVSGPARPPYRGRALPAMAAPEPPPPEGCRPLSALLNGIAQAAFHGTAGITEELLRAQLYPEATPEEFRALRAKMGGLLQVPAAGGRGRGLGKAALSAALPPVSATPSSGRLWVRGPEYCPETSPARSDSSVSIPERAQPGAGSGLELCQGRVGWVSAKGSAPGRGWALSRLPRAQHSLAEVKKRLDTALQRRVWLLGMGLCRAGSGAPGFPILGPIKLRSAPSAILCLGPLGAPREPALLGPALCREGRHAGVCAPGNTNLPFLRRTLCFLVRKRKAPPIMRQASVLSQQILLFVKGRRYFSP